MTQNSVMSVKDTSIKETPSKRAPKLSQIQRTTQAVMSATVELLSEIGYRSLTIDLISQRSGIARSTIYRHWSNVPELTIQAFDAAIGPNSKVPDEGDVRSDLILLYKRLAKSLGRSVWGRTLPAMIEASHNDPNFKNKLSEMADVRRQSARDMLQRAKDRRELRPDANIEWMLDALSGALYHRLLTTRTSMLEPGLIEWLVDSVLSTTLRRS